jgi:hypothetical protein
MRRDLTYLAVAIVGSLALGGLFVAAGGPLPVGGSGMSQGEDREWRFETVTRGAYRGPSIAIDEGQPHVAFYQTGSTEDDWSTVRYAIREEEGWRGEEVKAGYGYTFGALDIGFGTRPTPQLVYQQGYVEYDYPPWGTRGPSPVSSKSYYMLATPTGGGWRESEFHRTERALRPDVEMRTASDGRLHATIVDPGNKGGFAAHARRGEGGGWEVITCRFDGADELSGLVSRRGRAHVIRRDDGGRLYHHRVTDEGCPGGPVFDEPNADLYWSDGVTIDHEGRLYVLYADRDADGTPYRLAIRGEGGWRTRPVRSIDASPGRLSGVDLEVTDPGSIHLVSSLPIPDSREAELRYTRRHTGDGSWETTPITRERRRVAFDLTVDDAQMPHLVYTQPYARSPVYYARIAPEDSERGAEGRR